MTEAVKVKDAHPGRARALRAKANEFLTRAEQLRLLASRGPAPTAPPAASPFRLALPTGPAPAPMARIVDGVGAPFLAPVSPDSPVAHIIAPAAGVLVDALELPQAPSAPPVITPPAAEKRSSAFELSSLALQEARTEEELVAVLVSLRANACALLKAGIRDQLRQSAMAKQHAAPALWTPRVAIKFGELLRHWNALELHGQQVDTQGKDADA